MSLLMRLSSHNICKIQIKLLINANYSHVPKSHCPKYLFPLQAKANYLQLLFDFLVELLLLGYLAGEGGGEFFDFDFKGDAVVLFFFDANIAPWGEDIVVFGDFFGLGRLAKACLVFVAALVFAPLMVGFSYSGDVFFAESPVGAIFHVTYFAGIDKEDLATAFAVAIARAFARDKPDAGRDARVVKELFGKGYDAIHQVVLDECFADFPLSAGLA